MAGLFWKCIVVLMTPLIVIGLIRMSLGADPSQFLPTYEILFRKFASMPDFTADVNNAVSSFNAAMAQMYTAWGDIPDLVAFFSAIGSFFNMVGQAFMVGLNCLAIPFKFLYWFMTILFDVSDIQSASTIPVVL